MGETADQLREEIEAKRQDATDKIEQIEDRVAGTADQVREQVSQTLDWRRQVDEKPLMALGAAFLGGVVLGSVLGSDEDDRRPAGYRAAYPSNALPYGQYVSAGSAASAGGLSITSAVRKAAKSAGFDETLTTIATSFMSMLSDRIKEMADRAMPGMAEKLDQASGRAGEGDRPSGRPPMSGAGTSYSVTAPAGSTPTSAADYARTGELGGSVANG